MTEENKKGFFEETLKGLGRNFDDAVNNIKKDSQGAADEAEELFKKADDAVGRFAIKSKKIYDDLEVDDRLKGAATGIKTGVTVGTALGARAGVHGAFVGAKVGGIVGGIVGAVKGPEGLDVYRNWLKKHEGKNDSPDPAGKPKGPS